jgi:hypothetical protein
MQSRSAPPANVPPEWFGLVTFYDRDVLGRIVREAWVAWASGQANPKPYWLLPYDELRECEKEADRQIGEAVQQAIFDAALRNRSLARSSSGADVRAFLHSRPLRPMPNPRSIPWPAVIAIAGHAKSGKSTLAAVLSSRLEVPSGSFGAEVRRTAAERGLSLEPAPIERETLMRLGEELVSRNLPEFCRRVLDAAGWLPGRPVVIEGVRHGAVAAELRRLVAPMPLLLVMIDTPAPIREDRLASEGAGPMTRAAMDAHSTEREVSAGLGRDAEMILDGTLDVEHNADAVLATLDFPR